MLSEWCGEFGDKYQSRQKQKIKERTSMWCRILREIDPRSILEVGAGEGANLAALANITDARLLAVEPNKKARRYIRHAGVWDGTAQSIPLDDNVADLVFTCGVLIHIHPSQLALACDEIYRVSDRHIACIEYFSSEPETKPYRGMDLYKRDFGSYWLDRFDLQVIDHGFFWHRLTGLDNLTFWLFRKE